MQAQIDLISQSLEAEEEKLERCRRHLDPEEQIRYEESKNASPQPNTQSISISEKILLKYKRSTELCSLYEGKY